MIASGPVVLAVTASLPPDTEVYLSHVISWPQRVTPAVPLVTAPAPCTDVVSLLAMDTGPVSYTHLTLPTKRIV